MKRIYRYILPAMVAALTPAACTNEDIEPDTVRDYPTFSASIDSGHSRAADSYWERGDKIGISGGSASNICHVTEIGDGDFTVEDPVQQFFFKDDNAVTFKAYYPYNSGRNASTGHINITTADQTSQKNFDFLWATANGSKAEPDVKFEFTHKMSKITFVFKNGRNMDVSDLTRYVMSDFILQGTFDTTEGECTADATASPAPTTVELTYVTDGSPASPLILFPQTLPETVEKVKLELYDKNNQYYVCYLTIPDKKLLAGNNYTYTITVNQTGLTVGFPIITDWKAEEQRGDASSAD